MIALGVWLEQKKFSRIFRIPNPEPRTPTVTVIVAARNEEKNIATCLESLLALNYEKEKLDFIIVSDHSTDRTLEIIRDYASRNPQITALDCEIEIGHLRGKTNAIASAMRRARGEIIMMTDADAMVMPTWVKTTVAAYAPSTGIIAGYTQLTRKPFFAALQRLDWTYLFTLAAAGMGWGMPLSCVGNNLSFRKRAYEEVGGYEAIPFSVTEDFALMHAIIDTGNWKAGYLIHHDAVVTSHASENLSALYHQKARWVRGGMELGAKGYLIALGSALLHVAIILAIIADHDDLPILIAGKFVSDLIVILPTLVRTHSLSDIAYFFFYEVYAFFLVITLPIVWIGAKRKVVWKGREYF